MNALAYKTDAELSEDFKSYVQSFDSKERHTKVACDEAYKCDKMIAYFIPNDRKIQVKMYMQMMDTAVEYEESGFIAGYRFAMKQIKGLQQPQIVQTTNSTLESLNSKHGATVQSYGTPWSISTKQIAKMFKTENSKVMARINCSILPHLSEDERKEFKLTRELSYRDRPINVYRMTRKACKIYLSHMEKWSGMSSVAEGIAELRKLVADEKSSVKS